jgi:hypothetical protein
MRLYAVPLVMGRGETNPLQRIEFFDVDGPSHLEQRVSLRLGAAEDFEMTPGARGSGWLVLVW